MAPRGVWVAPGLELLRVLLQVRPHGTTDPGLPGLGVEQLPPAVTSATSAASAGIYPDQQTWAGSDSDLP